MKQLILIFLLYLPLISNVTIAEEGTTGQKVESSPAGQSFCGVRQRQEKPVEKEADSIKSLFEMDFFQSHFEKNCLLSLGFKGWANTWSLPIPLSSGGQAYSQDTTVLFKSETEFTAMPTLTFRYKNFYLSANRFSKTNYSFGTQKIDSLFLDFFKFESAGLENVVLTGSRDENGNARYFGSPAGENYPLAIKVPIEVTPTADRSEWDLTLGYYVNNYLTLTVGYKKIHRRYKYGLKFPPFTLYQEVLDGVNKTYTATDSIYEWGNFVGDVNSDSKGSGITVGILGAVPIKGNLSLYGNLTYGWLNTDINSSANSTKTEPLPQFVKNTIVPVSSEEYDTPYYSGEVGFAYKLASFREVGFSFYAGYRFQRYEFEGVTSGGQTARDGTDGFIASFSAYF